MASVLEVKGLKTQFFTQDGVVKELGLEPIYFEYRWHAILL